MPLRGDRRDGAVPGEGDAERRAERAAESEAKRKGDQRRANSAAQALLAKFEASNIEIPVELRRELTTPAASVESLNKAVSKGLMLLQPTDRSEGVTERQRALADRLGAGHRRITLEEWTSQQTGASDDQALLKVDKLLGEMKRTEEKPKVKIQFQKGESVKIKEGPFESFEGIVDEVLPDKGLVKVVVTIFGRPTPVELEYWQVETV